MVRGEGLLRNIRFPFMSTEFVLREARGMLPECAVLEGLVLESALLGMASHLWQERDLRYLHAKVLVPRCGRGVDWAEYAGRGEGSQQASGRTLCVLTAGARCAGGFMTGQSGCGTGPRWRWSGP